MTVTLQTLLDRSNKNMAEGTHPVVRESALEMIKRAYKEGIYVQISEGHRTNERQNQLYAQGRTTSGNIVTNAKAGQSLHNYGTAIDFFIVSDDGKQAIWKVDAKWRRAASIAKSLGFEWGGDWIGFKDNPHLQMMGGLTLKELQAGKRPHLVSKVGNNTYVPPAKQTGSSTVSNVTPSVTVSIVDYLNSKNIDSSFANRSKLAKEYGVANYTGTAKQNETLLSKIKVGKVASKPKPKKNTVTLPANATTWRTYKTNVQPIKANSDWSLTPSKFGGLTYDIIGKPYTDVVTINTSRGKRNIYVGKDTGAVIK